MLINAGKKTYRLFGGRGKNDEEPNGEILFQC